MNSKLKFADEVIVGNAVIGDKHPVYVIAEAGVNHNGDINLARQLIDVACSAGADAVKFQSFKPESLILKDVPKARYQCETTSSGESQLDMLRRLSITLEQTRELLEYCNKKGIQFITTPFDLDSLNELDELDLPAYKIASTDTTNLNFLRHIARKGKPIFISTGMCYLDEVRRVLEEIHEINTSVILLQCTANYPISNQEANLNVLKTYRECFDMILGYSDHTIGHGAAPFAVPMGARVVEKHFCISREMEGPDQRCSLEPSELCEFIQTIRRVETYMGKELKMPELCEVSTRQSLQKCLVASRSIRRGEEFTYDNLNAKRTGGQGISALYVDDVVGNQATRDYSIDDVID